LIRLGRDVLRQTCAEIAGLPDGPATRFSIDLTVRQLNDPGCPAALLEALAGAALQPAGWN
jgi:EAL domain-containing protein (putative c-di-GMP-specific phosphodiesterase class I)